MTGEPSVPLLDLTRENAEIWPEVRERLAAICKSGQFILGPETQLLERQLAEFTQAGHAVGCASGSDALLLALMGLGIGPEDEVIVPSFTFIATASAVWRLGATPVFVDICPQTFNITAEHISAAMTPATRAIIPVHLFGQCAPMKDIMRVAGQIPVVEDAAQALGATHQSRPAGSIGDVGCFSFYPTKNLGGWGDGGVLTTTDEQLADRIRMLRGHGMRPRYHHHEVGINSRLDSVQAAVLSVKLNYLERWTETRRANAKRYQEMFYDANLTEIKLPYEIADGKHVWNQFTIRVHDGRRDALRQHLEDQNISSEVYYPIPLHQQSCFRSLGYDPGSLPATETAAAEVLSLPIYPGISEQQQRRVVSCTQEFFRRRSARAA